LSKRSLSPYAKLIFCTCNVPMDSPYFPKVLQIHDVTSMIKRTTTARRDARSPSKRHLANNWMEELR
jgi:hypothetical protein